MKRFFLPTTGFPNPASWIISAVEVGVSPNTSQIFKAPRESFGKAFWKGPKIKEGEGGIVVFYLSYF